MTNHFGIPMKEKIVKFEKSKIKGKKYKVTIKNKKTSKERTLHFGGLGYEQYKDSTPLKLYKNVNHNTKKDGIIILVGILVLKIKKRQLLKKLKNRKECTMQKY